MKLEDQLQTVPALPFMGTADTGVVDRSLSWSSLEPWTPGLGVVLEALLLVSSKDLVMWRVSRDTRPFVMADGGDV